MHQIITDGMTPVNQIVIGGLGVVLVEEVILAFPLNQAAGIVHPVGRGRKEVPRTAGILVLVLSGQLLFRHC